MTVTFLSEARSNAVKRSSRRIRPAVRETPVEVGRELGTARGVVVTRVMLARYGLIAIPKHAAQLASTKPDSTRQLRESVAST